MRQNRILLFLNYFVKNPDTTIDSTAKYFNCTRRQIMYDLSKINSYLEAKGIEQIKILSNRLHLTSLAVEKIKSIPHSSHNELIHISGEYRIGLMAVIVYCKEAESGIVNFMQAFKISKGSVINDLKKLSANAEKYNVGLEYSRVCGYYFVGSEENIRAFVFYMSARVNENINAEILVANVIAPNFMDVYNDTTDKIWSFTKSYGLDIFPDYMALIILFISILQIRTRACESPPINIGHIKKEPMYEHFSNFFDDNFGGNLPLWEKDYLYLVIFNAVIDYKDFSQMFPDESQILREISEEMINRFSFISCTFIINSEKFVNNLFFHLQPAFFRLVYGIPIINPILHKIREDYGHFFPIVSIVLKPFAEYVKKPIPEDELAYITIILISMLENIDESRNEPLKGAIVCQNGIASSAMLKKQLEKLFSVIDFESYFSVNDFLNSDISSYDIVFTTVSIPVKVDVPVFKASPFMSDMECLSLWKEVYSITRGINTNQLNASAIISIVEKFCTINDRIGLEASLNKVFNPKINNIGKEGSPMLKDLLTKETIRFAKEADNWEKAIELCAQPLREKGYIEEEYVTACIESVKKHGPYIVLTPLVAMPHAQAPEYVNCLSMSYLNLEKTVDILDDSERTAKILIMLAADDKTRHLKALASLSEILINETKLNRLIYAKSVDEVLEVIINNEN